MPKYGSLFSGVGGFDMGFDQAGYDCVFQVEWDKNCQQILAKHWPEVPKWSDVQEVNGGEVPPCDVLTFGSPCQDLSVAGKRAGLDGGRSSMFYEATRIIKEMRNATNFVYPRVVVWENVPGALSSNNGADFAQVLDTLADIGAVDIHWSIVDAQYFGVPQRRRRIFVVAIFDPTAAEQCPETLLPLTQGSRGDFKKSRTARENPTGDVEASLITSGQWAAGSTDDDILTTSVCSKWAKGSGGPSGSEHYNMVIENENVGAFVKAKRAMSNTDNDRWEETETAPTLNAFDNSGETRATVLMPVAYSIREDAKANTFSATETDTALCLNGLVPSTQSHHAQIFIAEPQTIIFENSYRDGPRIGDDICHTLPAKMGLGGGNTPMLAQPIVYDGYNQSLDDTGIHRSLRIGRDSSDFIAQPTIFIDRAAFNQGENAKYEPVISDDPIISSLVARGPHAVFTNLAVRRLTPLECERLMGWPDDHTRWTADGKEQADTNRYKQCGNGVATPVAKWIAHHIKNILETK